MPLSRIKTVLPAVLVSAMPLIVLAAEEPLIKDFAGVLNLVCRIFYMMYTILVILAVVFVLVAAFKYITAGGDAEKFKMAHKTLLYAVIGLAVAMVARGVPSIVASVFGEGDQSVCEDTSTAL